MNDAVALETWNVYQSAWGPVSDAERRDLLARSVADDIVYTDPASQVTGSDALAKRIAQSQAKFTGYTFRNDQFMEHHGQAIFHWTMFDADGAVFLKGSSFGRFGEDGRLTHATGFFEAPNRAGDG